MPQGQLRNLLGGFLFRSDEVQKLVSVLSGGERSRLLLCQLMVQRVNFLLLDEPTNHLDIQGRRVLETALKAYGGTFCLVSHDRHLINAVVNKIMVITNHRVESFQGNYDDFEQIWKKRLETPTPAIEQEAIQSNTPSASKKDKVQRRLEAKWRNELNRQKAPLTQRLESLELTIDDVSSRLDELSRLLAQQDTYESGANVAELSREFGELKNSLEDYTRRWEETAMELEALEASFRQEKTPGD
jgi:ATP-binding cassette subfamily F protein 3